MDRSDLEGLVAAVPLPCLAVSREERVVAANAAAQAMFGADMLGRHPAIVFRQPALLEAVEAALGRGEARQVRQTIPGPSHDRVNRVTVAPVAGHALCSFQDISELEQMGQMRREFVANVSHELRTPLTALMGFIETLKGAARNDPAARDRFLTIMEREAGRMNRLVRDLLHLSRVEAEERVRPDQRQDLAGLVRQAAAALAPTAAQAGVALEVEGAGQPLEALADPDQMTQVLTNLIENAIRYGGAGKVVTVRLMRTDGAAGMGAGAARIEVIDRGEGIDPVHIPRLTERFYRVDTHRSREKGGTGLGLAIVKHIVNRHRGRLQIESRQGQGSTFSVTIPLG